MRLPNVQGRNDPSLMGFRAAVESCGNMRFAATVGGQRHRRLRAAGRYHHPYNQVALLKPAKGGG